MHIAMSRVSLMSNLTVVALVIIMATAMTPDEAAAATRALFVFGDSLVDSGNNNFLATSARANFPPNGIDYPTHRPTGRFSNGLNLPDIISESMSIEPPLPYLNPQITSGQNLMRGANFASAGIGILNDTGIQFLNIIRMPQQLELFKSYQVQLSQRIGQTQAQQLIKQALVLITVGGNDFVNNYFLTPFAPRRRQFTLPQYCSYLISEYKKILKKLFDELGARRVIVTGTGPLGCIPASLAMSVSRNGKCAQEPQRAEEIYNSLLVQMIQDLNNELGSGVFVASNAFDMNRDFISNPKKFGFETSKEACCGQGPYNGLGTCNVFSRLCRDRNAYVFWDAYHPTERTLRLIARNIVSGSTKYMNPMNLSTIMDMRTH